MKNSLIINRFIPIIIHLISLVYVPKMGSYFILINNYSFKDKKYITLFSIWFYKSLGNKTDIYVVKTLNIRDYKNSVKKKNYKNIEMI